MHLDRIGEEFTVSFFLPCEFLVSSHRFRALQFLSPTFVPSLVLFSLLSRLLRPRTFSCFVL